MIPPLESIVLKETEASQRLLVAFAHPDDESFGPSGTLIHYAKQDIDVHYICGTRGEAGEVEAEHLQDHDNIGALRTAELRCAAQVLGLSSLHFLNYHDSGMENSPANDNPACLAQAAVEDVAERITQIIRQIQPQVVLTFDPQGGYFHPDHIQMHRATTFAFQAAGDPGQFSHQIEAGLAPYQPQKLYYTAFNRGFIKLVVKLLPLFRQDPTAFGKNKDINLKRIADIKAEITTRIRVAPYFDLSLQAAACHASQASLGPQLMPKLLQKWLRRFDTYTRVAPAPNGAQIEIDLFADVA